MGWVFEFLRPVISHYFKRGWFWVQSQRLFKLCALPLPCPGGGIFRVQVNRMLKQFNPFGLFILVEGLIKGSRIRKTPSIEIVRVTP